MIAARTSSRVLTLSVDSSLGAKLLPTVLSLVAGSVDVIGFLGLGGLFTAHIAGNLVILAAQIAAAAAPRWRRCCQCRYSLRCSLQRDWRRAAWKLSGFPP